MSVPQETRPRVASSEAILEVLLGCDAWEPFHGPTGKLLWRMPGADAQVYTVSRVSCTCPWSTYSQGEPCKHRRALEMFFVIAAAIRRKRRSDPQAPPKETPDSVV